MITNCITIGESDIGVNEALMLSEKVGVKSGLDRKQNLRLRLLSEELFGTLKGIAGDVSGRYYIENEDKQFNIHMTADVDLTSKMKQELLSVSSTGENAAVTGLVGRLFDRLATAMMSVGNNSSIIQPGLMAMGSPDGYQMGYISYQWYLNHDAPKEEWDGLEKSIFDNIADDVSISIIGSKVDINIAKAF